MGLFSKKQINEIELNNSQIVSPINSNYGMNHMQNDNLKSNGRFSVKNWEPLDNNGVLQNRFNNQNQPSNFYQNQYFSQDLPIVSFNNQLSNLNNFDSQQRQYLENNLSYQQPFTNNIGFGNNLNNLQQEQMLNQNQMYLQNDQFIQNQQYYNQPINFYQNQAINPQTVQGYNGYNNYNNNVPQSFSASKFEDEFIDDAETTRQKILAKKRFGEKFVTKGVLPKELRFEIGHEKIRIITLITAGLIGLLYVLINLILTKTNNGINLEYTPSTFIIVVISIISLVMVIFGTSDYFLLSSNVKKCRTEAINYGKIFVPHFVKRNYRKIITRYIYVNWLCFSAYVIIGITIGVLEFLNNDKHFTGPNNSFKATIGWFTLNISSWEYRKRNTDILISVIILLSTLSGHIYTIVDSRVRKNNIISLYETEIISVEEATALKKRANRICLTIFIAFVVLLLFVFAITYLILKRRSRRVVNKNTEVDNIGGNSLLSLIKRK